MENINIGIVNLMVSSKLKESYLDNGLVVESQARVSSLLSVIKASPILQLEFKIFNNIENKHIDNEFSASRYIDNNIKLFEVYTLKEVEIEHRKLVPFINENIISDKTDKVLLYNSIWTLIKESLNEYSRVDVDAIHESFTLVLNHIRQPKISTLDKVIVKPINEEVILIAVDKFNEKYDNLDEGDRNLLQTLIKASDEEKEGLLESYKSESLILLEGSMSDGVKENILKAINKIREMKYKKGSVDDDIISLHELKKDLL